MNIVLRNLLALIAFVFAAPIAVAEMYEAMENVSVHDFPDRSATQIGVIKKGQTVKVRQKAGIWLRVSDYESVGGERKAQWAREGSFKSFALIEREREKKAKEEAARALEEKLRLMKEEEEARRALNVKTPATGYLATLSENAVRSQLKDPSSAQFRGQFFLTPYGAKTPHFCGEVNAKNSWGAYTGFKRFAAIGKYVSIDDGSSDFNRTWDNICR